MPIPRSEKPLHWVGLSKKDLLTLPAEVVDDFGYALGVVQAGATPPQAKPWKGEGAGVLELVENHRGDTFRVVYTVRFAQAVYVLHCFQKKSPSGVRTGAGDIAKIGERLKLAQQHYKDMYEHQD